MRLRQALAELHRRPAIVVAALGALSSVVIGATVYNGLYGCASRGAAAPATAFNQRPPSTLLATPNVLIISDDRTFQIRPNQLMPTPFAGQCPAAPDTQNYGEAEHYGARRVRVAYPGLAEPLYGVMSFCTIADGFHGSASRSYRVEVPEAYVQATEGGRVSVVFEHYPWETGTRPAWVLWLSREPMPQQAFTPPAPARRSGC